MIKWLITPILFIILSCGTSAPIIDDNKLNNSNDSKSADAYNVLLNISHHGAYCGGMAPTPEMLAALNYQQANTIFVLVHKSSNTKANVKTDSLGVLKLSLVPGQYAIREYFKNCSFDEFLAQQKTAEGQYFEHTGGDECYRNWWETNLLDFEITQKDSVLTHKLSTSTRCFVGNNPCLIYTGPYPP